MKILMSGASGFIGKRLCESLYKDQHELTALTRSTNTLAPINHLLASIHQWNGSVVPDPDHVLKDCDVIINLVGESIRGYWTSKKRDMLRTSRLSATRALVTAVNELRGYEPMLISASAIGYYGDRGEEILSEQSAQGNSFLSELTTDWEEEAMRLNNASNKVVLLRLGVVLGSGGGLVAGLKPIYNMGLGGTLGKGNQWWSWIHIDDVIGVIKFVISQKLSGPVNLVSPNPERQKAFSEKFAKLLGRRTIFELPAFVIKIASGGVSEEILSSRNVVPVKLLENEYKFVHPNLEDALAAL